MKYCMRRHISKSGQKRRFKKMFGTPGRCRKSLDCPGKNRYGWSASIG